MTGLRIAVGYSKLERPGDLEATTEPVQAKVTRVKPKSTELPYKDRTTVRMTPKEIIEGNLLKGRFGAGVEVTINRNKNLEYKRDLGFREITMVTPGMYDLEFSLSGYLSVSHADWISYLFMNDGIVLSKDTICYDKDGVILTAANYLAADEVFLKANEGISSKKLRIDKDSFAYYMASMFVTASSVYNILGVTGKTLEGGSALKYVVTEEVFNTLKADAESRGTDVFNITLFGAGRLNPISDFMFDIGTVQLNSVASRGKLNEVGIITGCVLTSGSFSYEATGDTGVKFTLDGIALKDYIQLVTDTVDYLEYLDEIDSDIFAVGCLSVSKYLGNAMETIAHTDSANLSITNTVEKLAECGELIYGGLALGSLEVEMSVQSYSNDPNRYLPTMYGLGAAMKEDEMVDAVKTPLVYNMAKLPKPFNALRIRSTDAAPSVPLTKFLDIVGQKVYVGAMNKTYAVDSKIMDEPTLKPITAWIAIGKTTKKV